MARREVGGVGMLCLSLFLAGVLATYAVGSDGGLQEVRGAFGVVGAFLARPLVLLLGWSGAVFLPVLPAVHGLRLLGRLDSREDRDWLRFIIGVALTLPIAAALALRVGRELSVVAGLWGGFLAFYLERWVGAVGAWLVVLALLCGLTIATLAWNPLQLVLDRLRHGPRAVATAAQQASDAARAALAMAPPPEELPAIDDYALASPPSRSATAANALGEGRPVITGDARAEAAPADAEDAAAGARASRGRGAKRPPVIADDEEDASEADARVIPIASRR
nr:DNA translocase FtsK 4TM domain-containing protein [Gemmatimonadaceae bacterium]